MKRLSCAVLAAAFLALSVPADSSAQASVFVGGGATIPTSDYNDFAKVGWMGWGGVLFPVGEAGISVGAEGFYGSNSHDTDGDKTNLLGGLALAGYTFGEEDAIAPAIFGGIGFMKHQFKSDTSPEGSNTDLAAGGGAGVFIPAGSLSVFVGGSFTTGFSDNSGTKFIGIGATAVFAVGG